MESTTLIERYKELSTCSTNLSELMDIRKELSVEAYNIGVEAARLKNDLETTKGRRKVNFYKSQLEHLSEGVGKSVVKAENDVAEVRIDEARFEGQYVGAKIILDQVNQVLSSISQDIAQLRLEYKSNG